MPLLTPAWIVGFVFAYCFFMGGRLEVKKSGGRSPGAFWALASIIVTAIVIQGLNGGVFFVILGQLVVFLGITAWRVKFDK
jgi:hypothetical protein